MMVVVYMYFQIKFMVASMRAVWARKWFFHGMDEKVSLDVIISRTRVRAVWAAFESSHPEVARYLGTGLCYNWW